MFYQDPTITISDFVKAFKEGSIVLPEMQREYVWSTSQVKLLLDSIYRGYPTGSILLWEQAADDAATPPLASLL